MAIVAQDRDIEDHAIDRHILVATSLGQVSGAASAG
jgi:hypothetical protein